VGIGKNRFGGGDGTVLIFSEVPMLIFALLGGALVDRWPRLPVMMLSDLVRGLAVGSMAVLSFTNLLQVWHIYVISLIFGMVDAFFQPAYRASVPEIVPGEHLPSANSLTSLSGEISGIIGPALGAGMVALGGTSSAFALDGLFFFYFGRLPAANPTAIRFTAYRRTDWQHTGRRARRAGDGFW